MDEQSPIGAHEVRSYIVTKQEAFDYHKEFQQYSIRYPKYCQNIEITNCTNTEITTKEFWNVTLDSETDHALIEVRYHLTPNSEIKYEILKGNMSGVKNRIIFSDSKNQNYKSEIYFSLPVLDLTGHPLIGKGSSIYDNLLLYLRIQDAKHLEGKRGTFEIGQICPRCNRGKLGAKPGEIIGVNNNTKTVQRFQCDSCGETFSHTTMISRN